MFLQIVTRNMERPYSEPGQNYSPYLYVEICVGVVDLKPSLFRNTCLLQRIRRTLELANAQELNDGELKPVDQDLTEEQSSLQVKFMNAFRS